MDNSISIVWNTDDVLEVRPDLTQEQACEVLQHVKKTHDANIGVNWEVLETCAETLFPKFNLEVIR